MARTFTKNASNTLAYPIGHLSGLMSGKGVISVFARIRPIIYAWTGSGQPFNRVIQAVIHGGGSGAVVGFNMNLVATSTSQASLRVDARSVQTDGLQTAADTTVVGIGSWIRFGCVINFAADQIRIYLNGVQTVNATVSFANTTYTPGTPTSEDLVGGPTLPITVIDRQFEGDIADIGMWAGDIGTTGFEDLEIFEADAVRPDLMMMYTPLHIGQAPRDIWNDVALTIAGSIPEARHPRAVSMGYGNTYGRPIIGGFITLPPITISGTSSHIASSLATGRVWLFARSGLARSGATRSGYFFQNLLIKIAGVDRTDRLWARTLEFEEVLNEQADLANLRVFGDFDPEEHNEIIIALGSESNPIFGGTITKAKRRANRNNLPAYKSYDIAASDWTKMLSRFRVYGRYTGMPIHLIFQDIAAKYAPGFTTAGVALSSPSISDIEFSGDTVPEAYTRLVRRVAWQWYPTPGKDIRLFEEETSQNPQSLSETNFNFWKFDYEKDSSQLRTRVRVQGGGAETTVAVEPGSTQIPLPDLTWYSASGGTVQVGGQLITYTGKSTTAIIGIPPSGPGSITHRIPTGASVNIHVVVEDAVAIAQAALASGTDGIFEFPVTDQRLNFDGATSRGLAELVYAYPIVRGSYFTFDRFAIVGKRVTINLPAKDIVGVFPIVNVRARLAGPGRIERHVHFSSTPQQEFYNVLRRGGMSEFDAA